MFQSIERIKDELMGLTDNHRKDIKKAYDQGAGVTLTFKVVMEPQGSKVAINPSIEFYPLPKYKSEKYTVLIDEHQRPLFSEKKKESLGPVSGREQPEV